MIHNAIFSMSDAQLLLKQQLPSLSQLPHLNTEHNITWYQISCLFCYFASAIPDACLPRVLWKLTLSQSNPGCTF